MGYTGRSEHAARYRDSEFFVSDHNIDKVSGKGFVKLQGKNVLGLHSSRGHAKEEREVVVRPS